VLVLRSHGFGTGMLIGIICIGSEAAMWSTEGVLHAQVFQVIVVVCHTPCRGAKPCKHVRDPPAISIHAASPCMAQAPPFSFACVAHGEVGPAMRPSTALI
jgi:hypothetical protein